VISGLAILYSERAGAEQLRLECSIKVQDCHLLNRGYTNCTATNPASVSMLVEIDFDANTWVEFFTYKDGTQTSSSGKLISVTQYEITLDQKSYAGRTNRETISRTSGAYSAVVRFLDPGNARRWGVNTDVPTEVQWSGTCNKTTKPLPSAKF
jgi:hypothetical protein